MKTNINFNELTHSQCNAVTDYTLGRSESINKSLYKFNLHKKYSHLEYDAYVIKNLLDVISKTTPIKDEQWVFSGVKNIKLRKHYTSFLEGDLIHIPSFISTSIYTTVAQKFTTSRNGVILNICLPIGFNNGVFIKDLSEHAHENEFLIAPNHTFKVISIKKYHQTTHIKLIPVYNFCTNTSSLKNALSLISSLEPLTTRLENIDLAKTDKDLLKYTDDSNISVLRKIMLHKLLTDKVVKALLKNDCAVHYMHFIKYNTHIQNNKAIERLVESVLNK